MPLRRPLLARGSFWSEPALREATQAGTELPGRHGGTGPVRSPQDCRSGCLTASEAIDASGSLLPLVPAGRPPAFTGTPAEVRSEFALGAEALQLQVLRMGDWCTDELFPCRQSWASRSANRSVAWPGTGNAPRSTSRKLWRGTVPYSESATASPKLGSNSYPKRDACRESAGGWRATERPSMCSGVRSTCVELPAQTPNCQRSNDSEMRELGGRPRTPHDLELHGSDGDQRWHP